MRCRPLALPVSSLQSSSRRSVPSAYISRTVPASNRQLSSTIQRRKSCCTVQRERREQRRTKRDKSSSSYSVSAKLVIEDNRTQSLKTPLLESRPPSYTAVVQEDLKSQFSTLAVKQESDSAQVAPNHQDFGTMSEITMTQLGNREVPSLCLGTWSWGDKGTWKYNEERDLPGIKEAWQACIDNDIYFFDTANVYGYGESERIIGSLLKDSPEEFKKKIVIATKWLPVPSPVNWNIFSPKLVKACRDSCERLGVQSVDLYQIHGVIGIFSFESQAKELAECVKLGLAKQVGVSNFNKEEFIKFYDIMQKHGVQIVSNQVEYNLLRTLPENSGLLAAMRERNVKCLAYSPLAQGRLTGKYSAQNPPPSSRKFSDIPMEEIDPLIEVMRPIAAKYGVGVSAVALNWVIAKGAIPLGGARNARQATENAKAMTFKMTEEEVKALDALTKVGKTSTWQHG